MTRKPTPAVRQQRRAGRLGRGGWGFSALIERLPAPYELGPNTVGFALPEILASEANLKRKNYAPEAA